jgi:hypothetical protein
MEMLASSPEGCCPNHRSTVLLLAVVLLVEWPQDDDRGRFRETLEPSDDNDKHKCCRQSVPNEEDMMRMIQITGWRKGDCSSSKV